MNYSKELIKKSIYISILIILVISATFLAFYFINKEEREIQTFLPVENNTIIEETEKIERIIVVLNAKNNAKENTNNETNNTTNNIEKPNINNTTTYSNENNTVQNTPTYYIKVNYTANVVNIYTKDSSGNYTVPYKAMICSTGTSTPTSGVYPIQLKWKWLALFGDVYGYYTTQITGNILFHSVPYLEKGNPASLEYWEYDKLGTSASMGCIRLKVEDAMWIYNNCDSGTLVEFYSVSEPGPLGKPSASKISGYDSPYRDWDPTDPDTSNPWITNPPQ